MHRVWKRPAVWLSFAALAVACGPSQGQFNVAGAINATQGFILESESVVSVSGTEGIYDPGESDFYLAVTETEVVLRGATSGAFCKKTGSFADVEEIPSDTSDCSWSNLRIGEAEPDAAVVSEGDGYLVRDRDQAFVYRLRIVGSDYNTSGIATVYFDLAATDVGE
jgi:hypothetical protein